MSDSSAIVILVGSVVLHEWSEGNFEGHTHLCYWKRVMYTQCLLLM